MKKIVFLSLLLICVLTVCSLAACQSPQVQTGEPESSSDAGGDQTPPSDENAIVNYYDKGELTVNKISDLNTDGGKDTHADIAQYSSLEINQREQTSLGSLDLGGSTCPFYSRIRKLQNGQFIMTYQHGQVSSEVYVAYSKDGIRWSGAKKLFTVVPHIGGYDDKMLFMTADLLVSKEGTVIVVCTFRGQKNYQQDVRSNGMVVIRSSDNGKTWTSPEIIFTGTVWEPCINQLDTGEIQVYFTQTAHTLEIYGFDERRRSNGTGLLRSYDDGKTWTKQVGFSGQIVAQEYIMEHPRNYPCMAAQMPSCIQLHNGSLALAYELQDASGSYKLSIAYSKDNFAKSLEFFEEGPADIKKRFQSGGGPQLIQFESGETLLSFHTGDLHLTLGDGGARNFYDIYDPFDGHSTLWAGICPDTTHSVIVSSCNITSKRETDGWALASFLDVARLYLNHQIEAKKTAVALDGKSDDWTANTDAHFVGSETQAQSSIRVAHDDDNVYFLIERLDNYLTTADGQAIFLEASGGYISLKIDAKGELTAKLYNDVRPKAYEIEGLEYRVSIVGTLDDDEKDTGMIFEIKIPKSALIIGNDGLIIYNTTLYNKDEDANSKTDTFTGASNTDLSSWQRVMLAK